jgi:hypothetical protein
MPFYFENEKKHQQYSLIKQTPQFTRIDHPTTGPVKCHLRKLQTLEYDIKSTECIIE